MKKLPNTLIPSIFLLLIACGLYVYSMMNASDWDVPTVTWSFQESNMDAEYADPKTVVTVQVWDKKQEVGEYPGSCWEIPKEDREKGEISGIRCWWAGGGDDVGAFQENGSVVIKHRVLGEGSAEMGPFIGEFETIFANSF